jgi:hypothetical protein
MEREISRVREGGRNDNNRMTINEETKAIGVDLSAIQPLI